MRTNVIPSVLFIGVIVGLWVMAIVMAASFSNQARLFPWVVGSAAVFLGVVQITMEIIGTRKPQVRKLSGAELMDLPLDTDLPVNTVWRRSLVLFTWIIGLAFSIATVGFIISIPLYVSSYLRFQARAPWQIILLYTAIAIIVALGIFHYILHVPWLRPLFPWPQRTILQLLP